MDRTLIEDIILTTGIDMWSIAKVSITGYICLVAFYYLFLLYFGGTENG
jgi:hypothetical protein